jgi:tol-pal system protein YbgF
VGGFGATYLASDKNMDNRKVAIKEYLPTQLATRESTNNIVPLSDESKSTFEWGLDRFIEEAVLLSSLRHPNIVDVFTAFRENGTAYMVMRLEEGQTLSALAKTSGGLSQDFLMGILPSLLDGLETIHAADIIHRDIKPDNIIIRSDGSPVLIDFGSARKAEADTTQHLTSVYTPGYSPPEQRNLSDSKQGPWTDIYGLGATLYYSISGKPPRDSTARNDSIRESRSDSLIPIQAYAETGFSERFMGAVNWSLQYWPEDRPQSIEEWRSSLTPRAQAAVRQPVQPTPEHHSPEMDIKTEVSTHAKEQPDIMPELLAEPLIGDFVLEANEPPKKKSKWYLWLVAVLAIIAIGGYLLRGQQIQQAEQLRQEEVARNNKEKARARQGSEAQAAAEQQAAEDRRKVEALAQQQLIADTQKELNRLGYDVGKPSAAMGGQGSYSTAVALEGEGEAYRSAYGLLKNQQYNEAVSAFEQFLRDYPRGKYAPNAHFWIGHLYLVIRPKDLESSGQAFMLLVDLYPDSRKIPDALYKLGTIEYMKGNRDKARELFDRLIKDYGSTNNSAVNQARDFLRKNY